jgi:hypothetical protein
MRELSVKFYNLVYNENSINCEVHKILPLFQQYDIIQPHMYLVPYEQTNCPAGHLISSWGMNLISERDQGEEREREEKEEERKEKNERKRDLLCYMVIPIMHAFGHETRREDGRSP